MLLDPEIIAKEQWTKSQNRPDFHHSKIAIIAHSKARRHNSEGNTSTPWVIILHFARNVCKKDQKTKYKKSGISNSNTVENTNIKKK